MKELINKNIREYLFRIMIVYIIVMVSIPVWIKVGENDYSKTASYYESYNVYSNLSFIVK